MFLRVILPICFLLFQSVYSHASPHTQTWLFPAFTAVNVVGDINLKLHTGSRNPSVVVSGEQQALDKIQLNVIVGVLTISVKNPKPQDGPITVDIRSRYLNELIYHGKGTIVGDRLQANLERAVIDNRGTTVLKGTVLLGYLEILGGGDAQISGVTSRRLHVKMSGKSKLRLTGIVALKRLDMKDESWFSLSWEKSTTLVVRACDKAYIEIAGIVNRLDAEIWNRAQFNARYLRARRAFMKTHDYSVAHIAVTHHQHTLATDASDIRFYNLPEMKTDFLSYDGAVLDMRAFSTAFVEEPTPYNK